MAKDLRASKSGHIFCTQSCFAKYHNAHKTWGTRRSKLEGWLEENLRGLYPELDIHCNRTDAIQGELDFYFPGLKLAFELNGIFHYEPIYGGPEKLTQIQNNDARKMAACLERGIELCVVDTSQADYFKPKVAEKFLGIVRGVLDRVIDQRVQAGWDIQSADPTRGQTASANHPRSTKPRKPRKSRRRTDLPKRMPKHTPSPTPHFRAAIALERALGWSSTLPVRKASEIARQVGTSKVHVNQMLLLLRLPEAIRSSLLDRDPAFGLMSVSTAIKIARSSGK